MVTAMVTMQMESGPMTVVNQAVNARQITIAMFWLVSVQRWLSYRIQYTVYRIHVCYTAWNNNVLGACEPIGAICDYVDDVCLENYEFRTCDRPDWTGTLFIYKIFIHKRTIRTCWFSVRVWNWLTRKRTTIILLHWQWRRMEFHRIQWCMWPLCKFRIDSQTDHHTAWSILRHYGNSGYRL